MQIHYLEIVVADVEAACALYEKQHSVSFSEPQPELGGARITELSGGGLIGIRAPLRTDEAPIVRPYSRVEDLDAAVELARLAGAEIALPTMTIEGRGTIAIYIMAGIEYGLWQVP